jgi:Mg-dependent DNase
MYCNAHTHIPETADNILCIENKNPHDPVPFSETENNHFYSIGLHPWNIRETELTEAIHLLRQKAESPFVKAIGECGLDRVCDTPAHLQEKVFKEQISLSEQSGKPLIIHCVKAFDELIALKKELKPGQAWIIHGFRGKPQQMRQLVRWGFYLSLGYYFNKETLKQLPLDRLLAETDDSKNGIVSVYERLMISTPVPNEKIAEQIHSNFVQLFLKKENK